MFSVTFLNRFKKKKKIKGGGEVSFLLSPTAPAVKRRWILAGKGQWRVPFMGALVDVKWLGSVLRVAGSFPAPPRLSNSSREGGKVEFYSALSVHNWFKVPGGRYARETM